MKLFIITFIFFFGIVSLQSQQPLQVGSVAPDFTVQTVNGKTVHLSSLTKEKQVVLMFYRGQWCPYCNKQMSELQDSLQYINRQNAMVIAITPEKPQEVSKIIDKTGASFDIVYDENHRIMDLYKVTFTLSKVKNLAYKAWGIDINEASGNEDLALPVPATYIVNKQGVITGAFYDEDYKKRAAVKDIVAVLQMNSELLKISF
jgi:peroxiredoxin